MRLLKTLAFVAMIPVLFYSFFAISWTGSYIMLVEDWKEHTVFTPASATDTEQIYEIDKFLYAFQVQPVMSTIFTLPFLILLVPIIYWALAKRDILPSLK